ncbi:2-(3-amino-3-carboxypropyl)histidine synthase subunit 2-like, partial [Actinia tenebrosa]|uniref:2-(3-amino-3-carboxypropyl)histidine synthase subunit 2-like n=1 Tax=Actinia tenebrosa TaxID=6105 RepID=A0A6P8HVY2_ACTTE
MADESKKLEEAKGEISKALPFSNNDKDIIDRHINVSSVKTDSLDKLKDIYEIEKTVEIISKHNYENVALQFPDSLLSDSSSVASLLEKQTNARIYVLADTSYG